MPKKKTFFIGLVSLFIIGAGCNSTDQNQSKSAESKQNNDVQDSQFQQDIQDIVEAPEDEQITLSASVGGNNAVNFEWKVGDTAAQSSEGWRILYGKEPNPAYPSTWWFERSKPHREKLWSGLPAGKGYFRVCKVMGDACVTYSNNVEVDIPGATTTTEQISNTNQDEQQNDSEIQEQLPTSSTSP